MIVSLWLPLHSLRACGPNFPNNLLSGGDDAVLIAPEGCFALELARMNLVQTKLRANTSSDGYAAQAMQADLTDLDAALKAAKVPKEQAKDVLAGHRAERKKLLDFIDAAPAQDDEAAGQDASEARVVVREFPSTKIIEGLPGEFADYFEGSLAWLNPAVTNKAPARAAWQRLLERPSVERKFKSTWAAFMLGKSWEEEDPRKAIRSFQRVRELCRTGFRDSLGLGVASLGREARLYLKQGNCGRAIELYLEQWAAGDPSATNSLRFAAAIALRGSPESLQSLAKKPLTQRIITAYIIAQRRPWDEDNNATAEDGPSAKSLSLSWLAAVEAAGVRDVDSAEKLALAAYQVNQIDLAQRWIKRAPTGPVSQWLQAKLLLREGKLDEAASLLAHVAHAFPVEPRGTNEIAPVALKDTLFMDESDEQPDRLSAARQVWGELGVLSLARNEYVQALDALLYAGFWMDAAYVAERVLTLDELKGYVDNRWPAVSEAQTATERLQFGDDPVSPARLRENIRYLLARRLTRAFRGEESREYYPVEWTASFDLLMNSLTNAWNETLPATDRAQAFFEAAWISRTNGMELMGTEVEPDWHVHDGQFEEGVTGTDRANNPNAKVVVASEDELKRNSEHHANPELRFHYRYQAASLAWEASKLMPNNSDETARVLCIAGSWLKYRDPDTADIFYKSLVRRNRQTALGAEADRRRWFPELDAEGNFIPRTRPDPKPSIESDQQSAEMTGDTPDTSDPTASTTMKGDVEDLQSAAATDGTDEDAADEMTAPEHGYIYEVRSGDSLAAIVRAFAEAGVSASFEDIFRANPGLEFQRLEVGQKIFIPGLREQ